ncbi:MAG: hypothetical protein IJV98_03810 [Clostridia bacterium]|nr:hypothetical protein [Clostridia bacterium]
MKHFKQHIWKILLPIGIIPFMIPFVLGFYKMSIESWKLMDFLVLYSFLYWPTYLVGLLVIAVAIALLVSVKPKKK